MCTHVPARRRQLVLYRPLDIALLTPQRRFDLRHHACRPHCLATCLICAACRLPSLPTPHCLLIPSSSCPSYPVTLPPGTAPPAATSHPTKPPKRHPTLSYPAAPSVAAHAPIHPSVLRMMGAPNARLTCPPPPRALTSASCICKCLQLTVMHTGSVWWKGSTVGRCGWTVQGDIVAIMRRRAPGGRGGARGRGEWAARRHSFRGRSASQSRTRSRGRRPAAREGRRTCVVGAAGAHAMPRRHAAQGAAHRGRVLDAQEALCAVAPGVREDGVAAGVVVNVGGHIIHLAQGTGHARRQWPGW